MILDRTQRPEAHINFNNIHLKPLEKYTSGGFSCYYLNMGEQQVIKAEILLKAGRYYEIKQGTSFFASKLLLEGTKSKSAADIADFFSFHGAQIEISAGYDWFSISLYSLKKYFEKVYSYLLEIIEEASFNTDEIEIHRAIAKENLSVNLEKTSFLATISFNEKMYGLDHPYGYYQDEKVLSDVHQQDIIDYHRSVLLNTHPTLILVGNLDGVSIEKTTEKLNIFSGSQQGKKITLPNFTSQDLFIQKEGAEQSSLRLGFPTIKKSHPDYHKLLITNEVFGGYFGSRLMKKIREEKGYTYGIYSRYNALRHSNTLLIAADIKKGKAKDTVNLIRDEINNLANMAIGEEEFIQVRNYMFGSFCNSVATCFDLAQKFKGIYMHDLDYSYYDQHLATLENISINDIQSVANEYLNKEHLAVIVGAKD